MRSLRPPQVLLFGAMLAIALVIALFPYFPRQLGVSEGDIASRDIRSPRDATFESETLTEQARESLANAVADVLVPDLNVESDQLVKLDEIVVSIGQVRESVSLDQSSKRQELLRIVDRDSTDTILALADDRWQRVVVEAGQVLGGALGGPLAPSGAAAARDGLLQQVSPDLSAAEAKLVADLLRPYVVATLVIDEDATEQAREVARESVEPQLQTVFRNQVIVSEGERFDATAVEMLEEVGLLSPRVEIEKVLSVTLIAVLAATVLALYLWAFPVPAIESGRNFFLLALIVALPVLLAKLHFSLVLPDESRHFVAYFLPLAAAPMLVATLLGARLGIVIGLIQAVLLMFTVVSLPDLSLVETIAPVDTGRVVPVSRFGPMIGVFAVRGAWLEKM